MTLPGQTQSGVRRLPMPVRAIVAVGVFALLGPPIGGLVTWISMGDAAGRGPTPFVTGAYGEGVALATLTGLLVVAAAWFRGASWIVAIGAAILSNLIFHLAALRPDLTSSEDVTALMRVARIFLPASIVASVACWFLTRKLLAP